MCIVIGMWWRGKSLLRREGAGAVVLRTMPTLATGRNSQRLWWLDKKAYLRG